LNLKRRYESIDKLAEAPRREIENTIKVAGLGSKNCFYKKFLTTLKKKNGRFNLQYIGNV